MLYYSIILYNNNTFIIDKYIDNQCHVLKCLIINNKFPLHWQSSQARNKKSAMTYRYLKSNLKRYLDMLKSGHHDQVMTHFYLNVRSC